jgi:hypothetical protein
VIECHEWNDICTQQCVHQPIVEIKSPLVDLASPGWKDPRPRYRKAIRLQTDLFHQANIFFPEAIMVVCDITCVIIPDLARGVRKTIPGGFALAMLIPGAFDLIRSGWPHRKSEKSACHPYSISFDSSVNAHGSYELFPTSQDTCRCTPVFFKCDIRAGSSVVSGPSVLSPHES